MASIHPIDRSTLRGSDIRAVMQGEVPVKSMVTLCAWCEGTRERTAAVVASGRHVSHGICARHAAELLKDSER